MYSHNYRNPPSSAPVKTSICTVDILAFTGGAYSGDYGTSACTYTYMYVSDHYCLHVPAILLYSILFDNKSALIAIAHKLWFLNERDICIYATCKEICDAPSRFEEIKFAIV